MILFQNTSDVNQNDTATLRKTEITSASDETTSRTSSMSSLTMELLGDDSESSSSSSLESDVTFMFAMEHDTSSSCDYFSEEQSPTREQNFDVPTGSDEDRDMYYAPFHDNSNDEEWKEWRHQVATSLCNGKYLGPKKVGVLSNTVNALVKAPAKQVMKRTSQVSGAVANGVCTVATTTGKVTGKVAGSVSNGVTSVVSTTGQVTGKAAGNVSKGASTVRQVTGKVAGSMFGNVSKGASILTTAVVGKPSKHVRDMGLGATDKILRNVCFWYK